MGFRSADVYFRGPYMRPGFLFHLAGCHKWRDSTLEENKSRCHFPPDSKTASTEANYLTISAALVFFPLSKQCMLVFISD